MKNSLTLLVALMIALGTSPSEAAIVVDIGSIMLAPNGMGTIDITVSSDSDDPLQTYSMDLLIQRTGSSTLEFVASQSESHLTDSDYLLTGDSFGGGLFNVDTTTDANDTLTAASDFTNSFFDVNVPAATVPPTLLYRLDVQHFEDPFDPGNIGDTFTISATGFDFQDSFTDPYTPVFNSGTVTIASAVPEPSTFFVVLIALGAQTSRRRARKRV